jgi:alpha-beta hydrolase superfamily lysophospholipase/8-oxo-dGTP pyrophosphatase MutT (NUDIX family)
MSRQPRQIHVFLYRERQGRYEFAVFQRADNPAWWQGVCGGVEEGETIGEGARREIREEAGIDERPPLYRLDSLSFLPASIFDEEHQACWGKDVVVVPMYFFAMPFDGEIRLSGEHTQYQWLPYEEAEKLVFFHDQKTALWETNKRLRRGNLIRGDTPPVPPGDPPESKEEAIMEKREELSFTASDGVSVPVWRWAADGAVRGAVLVIHGMAEHAGRYGRFALALGGAGFEVWAPDLRGHGRAIAGGVRGSFGRRGGNERVLDDLLMLTGRISDAHPGIPIFLFGHSMGSLLGAALIERHGERFRAAVLSGVFVDRPIRRELSPLIARLLSGGRMEEPCQALNDMTFREYNRPFEGRTDFDWLSSLPEEVDKYVADPLCGFVCTASLYKDLGALLTDSLRSRRVGAAPDGLPVLFVAGERDSLGGPAAVNRLVSLWTKRGKNASGRIYAGSRHEVLNDRGREALTADVIAFYEKSLRTD